MERLLLVPPEHDEMESLVLSGMDSEDSVGLHSRGEIWESIAA
jgi:hypothetical protein